MITSGGVANGSVVIADTSPLVFRPVKDADGTRFDADRCHYSCVQGAQAGAVGHVEMSG